MRNIILILLLLFSTLFSQDSFQKELSSELRAEVYAQNLLDGGYDKKTNKFLHQALKLYPENETLMMFQGTAFFNLKDLENAKKYFMMVLGKDSTNEQASNFIGLIEAQEAAKENKAIGDLIEYLSDKGLDFIMIFLAFLGGEIIARKYNTCTTHETVSIINKFLQRKRLSSSIGSRLLFSLQQCCWSKSVLSFCFFLELLVTLTIVFALLIVWLMIEFLFEITIFLNESLSILSSEAIWNHSISSFGLLVFVTLVIRFLMKMSKYESKEDNYIIELAEHIEKLYTTQSYQHFYSVLEYLSESDYKILSKYIHNASTTKTIEQYFADKH